MSYKYSNCNLNDHTNVFRCFFLYFVFPDEGAKGSKHVEGDNTVELGYNVMKLTEYPVSL